MSQDPEEIREPETENEAKPTITIAEKDGDDNSSVDAIAKPTITIAEKDTDSDGSTDAE